MRYRIQIDSPRHRVHNEFFIEFRRTELGQESVHTERDRATWMNLETARIALRRLRDPQYNIRCRLLDEYGSEADGYNDTVRSRPIDIFNSHEELTYRDRGIEVPLIFNRALKKYYLKFTTSPDPNAPFDRSIAGDSPEEVLDRFLGPHTPAFVIDRYRVDETLPAPAPPQQPSGPMIAVPAGFESLGFRPGNVR